MSAMTAKMRRTKDTKQRLNKLYDTLRDALREAEYLSTAVDETGYFRVSMTMDSVIDQLRDVTEELKEIL
jgi:hypothetical protein